MPAGVTAVAYLVATLSVAALSPAILSMLLGVGIRSIIGRPWLSGEVLSFISRRLLRLAIMIMGFQITLQQIGSIGLDGFLAVVGSLVLTFALMLLLGRALGVTGALTALIAAGTSICGASAAVAVGTAIRAKDDELAYAVACVSIFGLVWMIICPIIAAQIGMPATAYGIWAGASVHEVPQAIAAAFEGGPEAGSYGTIAKLTRVMMLAPVVVAIAFLMSVRGPKVGCPVSRRSFALVPGFVLGFLVCVACNSLLPVSAALRELASQATSFMLSLSLAAVGLEVSWHGLAAKGARPVLLGALGTCCIATLSWALIECLA